MKSNTDFTIFYKVNLFSYFLGLVLLVLGIPVLVYGLTETSPIITSSLRISRIIVLFCLALTLAGILYIVTVIFKNLKKKKFVSVRNGSITFFPTPISKEPITLRISEVTSANIGHFKLKDKVVPRILVLSFTHQQKEYRIANQDLNENEFSKVCNTFVKESNRCKACQSTNVTWQGRSGHCHNCETITPRNADEFDWNDAYQAP